MAYRNEIREQVSATAMRVKLSPKAFGAQRITVLISMLLGLTVFSCGAFSSSCSYLSFEPECILHAIGDPRFEAIVASLAPK